MNLLRGVLTSHQASETIIKLQGVCNKHIYFTSQYKATAIIYPTRVYIVFNSKKKLVNLLIGYWDTSFNFDFEFEV